MRCDTATIVINEAIAMSGAIAISGVIVISRGYGHE